MPPFRIPPVAFAAALFFLREIEVIKKMWWNQMFYRNGKTYNLYR